jgi:hypothetical protein
MAVLPGVQRVAPFHARRRVNQHRRDRTDAGIRLHGSCHEPTIGASRQEAAMTEGLVLLAAWVEFLLLLAALAVVLLRGGRR